MFRKDEEARLQWSEEHVAACAVRQAEILDNGAAMLKPGGRLVYSTCTFAPEENEESIRTFLERHPEFKIEKPENLWNGFSAGRPEWTRDPENARMHRLEDTIRIWPHKTNGEGHYMAVLKKREALEEEPAGPERGKKRKKDRLDKIQRQIAETFLRETLTGQQADRLLSRLEEDGILFGDQLYLLPEGVAKILGPKALDGLRVLRAGLHLGTFKKNRLEPSHALALYLHPEDGKSCRSLNLSDFGDYQESLSYLKGMSLSAKDEKGWTLIAADGCSLGWTKQAGGILKNHYPKGLRWASE